MEIILLAKEKYISAIKHSIKFRSRTAERESPTRKWHDRIRMSIEKPSSIIGRAFERTAILAATYRIYRCPVEWASLSLSLSLGYIFPERLAERLIKPTISPCDLSVFDTAFALLLLRRLSLPHSPDCILYMFRKPSVNPR